MPSKRLRVLLSFTRDPDHQLEELTGAVITGLNGSKFFPNPPVEQAALQAALTDFTGSVAAAAQGGTHATALKHKKRHALVALLRQLALYVQANCNDDLATLLSSGFLAASTTHGQSQLPKPVITTVNHGNSGQLVVKVKAIRNAKTYELRYGAVGAAPDKLQTIGALTDSRSMPINGLTPGTTYTVQVRALGGSSRYSDWSDPVSHMCM
jgi:hypothetical protein